MMLWKKIVAIIITTITNTLLIAIVMKTRFIEGTALWVFVFLIFTGPIIIILNYHGQSRNQ